MGIPITFDGSIPERYHRYMGPLLFAPYADDLASRLTGAERAVLELACGTGILTARLAARLAPTSCLLATDLSPAMVATARREVPDDRRIGWRELDATTLPFPDGSFDLIVSQFGVMFFPDRPTAFREAHRALAPGGRFLFNVWDAMAANPLGGITHAVVGEALGGEAPVFMQIPFGVHDASTLRALLGEAGFTEVTITPVERTGEAPSAAEAAAGMVTGNPLYTALVERGGVDIGALVDRVAERLARDYGDRPLRVPMRALVIDARR